MQRNYPGKNFKPRIVVNKTLKHEEIILFLRDEIKKYINYGLLLPKTRSHKKLNQFIAHFILNQLLFDMINTQDCLFVCVFF